MKYRFTHWQDGDTSLEKTVISTEGDIILPPLTAYYELEVTPPPGIDLPTVGGIILGITDAGLITWALAHLAGLV